MNRFRRDILCTLSIKSVLLIVLWVVCFKGAEKNTVSMQQWLYGSPAEVVVSEKNHA